MPKWKDKLLTKSQAAEHLGMTPKVFNRISCDIPHTKTPGGHRKWWESDLDKWKEESKQLA